MVLLAKFKAEGFGFNPKETTHHYLVRIPKGSGDVMVFERFVWDEGDVEQSREIDTDSLRVILPKSKWDAVKDVLEKEFNRELTKNGVSLGKFKVGDTPVERLLGKELCLLLWVVEDVDPGMISIVLKNWLGLASEERCWLFTMTNATQNRYNKDKGWRLAIRYALTDDGKKAKKSQV